MRMLSNEEYRFFRFLMDREIPGRRPPGEPPAMPSPRRFHARITGHAALTGYAWKRVYPDPATPGAFIDWSPAETGNNAWESNGSSAVAAGSVVELEVIEYDAGGPRFTFTIGGSGAIPVNLVCDNPIAGQATATAPVTFVYTATNAITGASLGSGIVPEHRRLIVEAFTATKGYCWVGADGVVHLTITDEIATFGEDCAEGG